MFLPKGFEAVASLHGIIRAGAAYVPVDPGAPVLRGAGILADAGVKAVVVLEEYAAELREHWPETGPRPRFVVVQGGDAGHGPGQHHAALKVRGPLDARWEMVVADHRAVAARPGVRLRRPGLHPLYVGVDRQAQGGDALAPERLRLPRLVCGHFRADGGRPVRVARAVSLRPVDLRPVRLVPRGGDLWS